MALTNDQITALNFKDFYSQIRPYLNGSSHGGFTPIGTVISVMGKTAPLNYLVCDGTVYNIADYPELASYFAGQFDSANFFGGDGVTTFAVPDLRGEFLRGTGINSHSGQGDGANVGVHQDGTLHHNDAAIHKEETGTYLGGQPYGSYADSNLVTGVDKSTITNENTWILPTSITLQSNASPGVLTYTSRPTNTSVLYCIATKNIFMDAGHNYSTDEQVVGTWIDGKPIYQKSFVITSNYDTAYDISTDIGELIDASGRYSQNTGGSGIFPYVPFADSASLYYAYVVSGYLGANKKWIPQIGATIKGTITKLVMTFRYTKSTD